MLQAETEDHQPLVDMRTGRTGDLPFVFASWLQTYRHSTFARRIPKGVFFPAHHEVIARLLGRSDVIIAHPAGDPDTILGYLVTERPALLHYAYVKFPFRRAGLCRMMVGAAHLDRCQLTHFTDDARHLLAILPHARYNPYPALKEQH